MQRSLAYPVLAAIPAIAPVGHARQYPLTPIRIVIPFPPGDSLDTMPRLISPAILERLGQYMAVDNRTGAVGRLGPQHGARDAYLLLPIIPQANAA